MKSSTTTSTRHWTRPARKTRGPRAVLHATAATAIALCLVSGAGCSSTPERSAVGISESRNWSGRTWVACKTCGDHVQPPDSAFGSQTVEARRRSDGSLSVRAAAPDGRVREFNRRNSLPEDLRLAACRSAGEMENLLGPVTARDGDTDVWLAFTEPEPGRIETLLVQRDRQTAAYRVVRGWAREHPFP